MKLEEKCKKVKSKYWYLIYLIIVGINIFGILKNCQTSRQMEDAMFSEPRKSYPARDTWTMFELDFRRIKHEGGAPWEKVSTEIGHKFDSNKNFHETKSRFKIFVNQNAEERLKCYIPDEPGAGIDFERGRFFVRTIGEDPSVNMQFSTTSFQNFTNIRVVTQLIVDNMHSNCLRITTYLDKRDSDYRYYYEEGKILRVTNIFISNASKYSFFLERGYSNY